MSYVCMQSVIVFFMVNKVINLKYSRTDFEEIYFRNGGNKTFLNHSLKVQRNVFILFAGAFVLMLVYTLTVKENLGFLFFVGIMLCFSFYNWYYKALPLLKWKKEVKIYLDGLDKIKENKLILTENAFSVIQDKKETIEKWTEFKRAEIEEKFISLTSKTTTYLIPKKAMTSEEYEFLRTIFSEKMQNGL